MRLNTLFYEGKEHWLRGRVLDGQQGQEDNRKKRKTH